MFVLEYIKKRNFLNRNKKTRILKVETDVEDNEANLLEQFKKEAGNARWREVDKILSTYDERIGQIEITRGVVK